MAHAGGWRCGQALDTAMCGPTAGVFGAFIMGGLGATAGDAAVAWLSDNTGAASAIRQGVSAMGGFFSDFRQ